MTLADTAPVAATEQAAPEPPALDLESAAAQVFGEDPPAPEPAKEAPAPEAKPAGGPLAGALAGTGAGEKVSDAALTDDKLSARVEAAKKAELRAAREREAIAAQKAEIEKAQADLAETKRLAEMIKAAKLSPSKALELLDLQPKDFLERLATENEPGAIAAREVAKEAEERAKLQQELADLKKQIDDEKARAAQAKNAELRTKTESAFVAMVEAAADKYPHLIEEYTPEETVAAGYRVLDEVVGHDAKGRPVTRMQAYVAEHGAEPSDEEIAEYLEDQAAKRAKIRQERLARMGRGAQQKPSEGVPTGDLKTAQPDRGQSPRTLTSRAASEKAAAAKPWSQEAADEESIRILSAALKAG